MASYVSYTPDTTISSALFNFDAFGVANFKYSGTVRVSVSDSFTFGQWLASSPQMSSDVYTQASTGSVSWTQTQLDNINLITSIYSSFINLSFTSVSSFPGFTPANVGLNSDINISLLSRTNVAFSGESGISSDGNLRYLGARGDVLLNVNGFGSQGSNNDRSLGSASYGFHVLMHEIGHSLGLSHPHLSYDTSTGAQVIALDYAATTGVGFDKLGFRTQVGTDMSKEYYSIMSYDDQKPASGGDNFAQTPMILDVIALQRAYGEGTGTTSGGNDTITPGDSTGVTAYRTYFDTGGSDTINLANYSGGAWLNMGTSIEGASHLVGVSMSAADRALMLTPTGEPGSLRWFYGEFENAQGGPGDDTILGNSLANIIIGGFGNDQIGGGPGDDRLDGGPGTDTAVFSGTRASHVIARSGSGYLVSGAADGADTLVNFELLRFDDQTLPIGTTGTAVTARGAASVGSAIATQLAVVYLGRPVDSGTSAQFAALSAGAQPSTEVLNTMAARAQQDGAFSARDSSSDIVVNTFRNIMGFAPSAFEQAAWAQYIDNGVLTRSTAPWVIFQSYLGASNVPDVYKLPTQARFVAAQTFGDYTVADAQIAALAASGGAVAAAARNWLSGVDSVAAAALKMQTLIADIDQVTLVGTVAAPLSTL